MLFLEGRIVAVHHLGPLLLRRKRRAQRWAFAARGMARTKIRVAQAASNTCSIGVPLRWDDGPLHSS